MSTPDTQEAIENELREIQGHLDARTRRMRFSPGIETAFRHHLQSRAIELLQHAWWLIVIFYLVIGVTTYTEFRLLSNPIFRDANLDVWWAVYLVEGVVITLLLLLPRLPSLNDWYTIYTCVIGGVAVVAITIATSAFPDPYFNQHSSYVVIFIVAIVYGIGGLRLVPAIVACCGGGLVAFAVIIAFDLWFDAGNFGQYMVLANVVGIVLGYLLEHRDRIMFLQSRLLEIEKGKLDQLSRELTRLSREDVLTGLANRRHFNEMFQQEWDRARRESRALALIFVDIDHFKHYNDAHGHLEGDRALTEVGMALKSVLRRPGDMAARYGGEEFVLLLPSTHLEGAMEVAAQVRESIEGLQIPHRASRVAKCITASVGVASLVPSPEMRSAQLLARADEAVYAAKAAGRNRIIVADEEGFSAQLA